MKRSARINFIVIFVSLFLVTSGVFAMGIGDLGRVCLFSAMSGVITLDGVPVVKARLVRTADRDGEVTDETVTDDKGYFKFPPIYERTITKYLPQEFVASQKILVYVNNKEYEMWSGVKRTEEENAESRGKPLVVTCELNSEKKHIWVELGPYTTRCVWDVEPDVRVNWGEVSGFEPGTEDDDSSVIEDDDSSPVNK